MTRPDLDDLGALVLVAETGSIGQAATRLGVSQPSLSRRMSALERSLKVTLLHRTRTGTTLTTTGRAVVDWATVLLRAAEDFSGLVETLRHRDRHGLRVAVSMTIAEHYAPRWLGALKLQHPAIEVALTVANSAEVVDLVSAGTVDVGFIESPRRPQSLRTRRLGHDELMVAVAPGHSWAGLKEISAATLAGTPLLVREVGSGTRETLEHAMAKQGLSVTVAMAMASNAALRSVAVAGLGPVVLSARALADPVGRAELVQVRVQDLDLSRPLTAVVQRDVQPSTEAAHLVEIARAAVSGRAYSDGRP